MSANEQTTRSRGKRATKADTSETPATPEVKIETYQLFDKEGNVLFTSSIEKSQDFYRTARDKHFAENLPTILRNAMDQEVDLEKLCLASHNLAGINLRNMYLVGIDFHDCNFNEADLRGANMVRCDLSDCAFDSARMTGADLTGANLTDSTFAHVEARDITGLIMLCELNDYFLYGYPRPTGRTYPNGQKEQELRIKVGCRDFNLPEARQHWSYDGDDKTPVEGREEIWAALPLLETIAKRRGWRTTWPEDNTWADGPRPASDVDEEDEE